MTLSASIGDLGQFGTVMSWRTFLLLQERETDSLLALVGDTRETVVDQHDYFLPTPLYPAWAHRLRGDELAARREFESAQRLLDSVVIAQPDNLTAHATRGLALAGLARKAEALQEARWLQRSAIYRGDALAGSIVAEARAAILAQVGEADPALDEIERLLAGPSWLSVHTLRLDPLWDPIRQHPRFKMLLVKYANPEKWAVR